MRSFGTSELKNFLTAGGAEFVAERCQILGISQATFYRRVTAIIEAFEFWQVMQPAQPHPLQDKVLAVVVEHPYWGCARIAKALNNQVTPPTIQAILNKNNLTSKVDRARYVHNLINDESMPEPTQEQARALFKANLKISNKKYNPSAANQVALIAFSLGKRVEGQHYALIAVCLSSLHAHCGIFIKKRNSIDNAINLSASVKEQVEGLVTDASQPIPTISWSTESVGKVLSKILEGLSRSYMHGLGNIPIVQEEDIGIVICELKARLKYQVSKLKREYGKVSPDHFQNIIAEQMYLFQAMQSDLHKYRSEPD